MYSKSTNNVIQKYDHQLPSSNNKSIEKCKFEKNNIRRSSRRHVIKCHNKKRSSLLSSLMSRIERRDMLVIITFLVILISVVRPSTGTIVCNDENDCKEKCDRHCDFPIERNVDSNGKGLPGMYHTRFFFSIYCMISSVVLFAFYFILQILFL